MVKTLFYSFLLGIPLGILYDVFEVFSLSIRKKGATFFLDFFYFIVFALVFFSHLLIFDDGHFRSLYLIFTLIGIFLYRFTGGYALKALRVKLAQFLYKMRVKNGQILKKCYKKCKKVLQLPYRVLYNNKHKYDRKIDDDLSEFSEQ